MKIKRVISLVIVLALTVTLCAACGNDSDKPENSTDASSSETAKEKFELTAAKAFATFENEGKVVICWGDSLTQGMSMSEGYTYPQHLQGDLNGQYKVINAGVPGENSNTISARANVIQAVLTNDIVFDKGKSSVELNREFLSVTGGEKLIFKGFGNGLPFDKIIIDGQTFMITFKNGSSWEDGIYTLVRQDTDTKLTLKKGTEIKLDYTGKYESIYCNVILMGGNDSGVPTEELINRYRNIGSGSDKNIYIIPYSTEEDVAAEFKAAFGDNALDMRDYFVNHAHKDYDLEVTKLDEWCIKKSKTPATFCLNNDKNDSHLSDIGYKVMADQVYKKGVELGYWK